MLMLLSVAVFFILFIAIVSVFFQRKKDVFEKALAMAAMGNFLDARGMIRSHIEGSPNDEKAHYIMSKIYSMEGDYFHEAEHLEKIKIIGKYENEFNPLFVSNRIADIYYKSDKYEEALFHYLDSIEIDPTNLEALVRIGFMALGQSEFRTAEYFFDKVVAKNVKFSSFFVAKGLSEIMNGKQPNLELFKKAFSMESSAVNGFMYCLALYKKGDFKPAIDIANKIIDEVEDEYVRYTLFQFIMIQYMLLNDLPNAVKHARLCMENARMNGWKPEFLDSEYYFSIFSVAMGRYAEVSEFLIDLESERVDDPEVIALANYKHEQEHPQEGGESQSKYNIEKIMQKMPEKTFPTDSFYELSGMRSDIKFNLADIVSPEGKKLIKKLDMVGIDKFSHFIAMSGNAFKNACVRIATLLKYRVSRELPHKDNDGLNFIAINKENLDEKALFRIRKWKGAKVSDVFLRDMLAAIKDLNLDKGYLIADASLTEGARSLLQANTGRLVFISGKELGKLLDDTLG